MNYVSVMMSAILELILADVSHGHDYFARHGSGLLFNSRKSVMPAHLYLGLSKMLVHLTR